MEQLGKVISFGHKKGGVGKSTLLLNFANYVWQMGHKVAVIDCDDRDVTAMKIKDKLGDNQTYDIIALTPQKLPEWIDDFLIEYDFVFLDLPGALGQPGVMTAYEYIDYLFIPTRTTNTDMTSTLEFIQTYRNIYDDRQEKGFQTIVYVVFNFVKSKKNPELMEYSEHRSFDIVNFLDESFPDKIEAQRELNAKNVIKPFEPGIEKMYEIVKQNSHE